MDNIDNVYTWAIKFLDAGLSIIPIIHKDKIPAIPWKEYQKRHPTGYELSDWFVRRNHSYELAIIGGKISGNVEIIDIDNHFDNANIVLQKWKELVSAVDPTLLESLYIESTQSGGFHIIYRISTPIAKSAKLASRYTDEEKRQYKTFIETKGEGGYALVFPSTNYNPIQGSLTNLPILTQNQREILITSAFALNEVAQPPKYSPQFYIETQKDRPGDIFNQRGDIRDYLVRHGWILAHISGTTEFWRRPGKKSGWSATYNFIPGYFYVFSSNAYPFSENRIYDKFSVFALLECNGDFQQAAKRLAMMGFSSNGRTRGANEGETKIEQEDLFPLTEVGNAQRFHKMFKDFVKFNHTDGKWYIWSETHWKRDERNQILEMGKMIAEDLKADESKYLGTNNKNIIVRYQSWLRSSQTERNIKASLTLAASIDSFATTSNDWDKNDYLVNFLNGTFNLITLELHPHRREDMITKIIPIEYIPDAKAPLWEESLNLYFGGDQGLIEFVQKACSLSLCGAHLEEVIFLLYGTGANGKSIFVKILQKVFSDYADVLPIESLLLQNFIDFKRNEIAKLINKRFVTTTEVPLNQKLNESAVKMLTGGDPIVVRFLRQEFFTMYPKFTLWIFGNHKPEIRGADEGIWRRIRFIHFKHKIPEHVRKKHETIIADLWKEREGIVAWLVNGWKKYIKEGLTTPPAVEMATSFYKDEQDILYNFFADKVLLDNKVSIKGKDLYDAYVAWCKENNEAAVGKKTFFNIIQEKGFSFTENKHDKQKYFQGISLKLTQSLDWSGDGEDEKRGEDDDVPF